MNRNITAVILIILAIGVYITVTKDMVQKAQDIKAINTQYETALKNADTLIRTRDHVRDNYNQLSDADKTNLTKMIPPGVDNIRLIIDMNSIAFKHGFSLRNIKASAAPAATKSGFTAGTQSSSPIAIPTLDTISVTFSVTASYQQFVSFLQDLESNLRIMDLTHLTVAAGEGSNYDFGVELKTYWLRQ